MRLTAPVAFFLLFLTSAIPAFAQKPSFALPLACHINQDCWIANYVDDDPSTAAADFQCRTRTYDGHNGTDFALRDLVAMQQGTPVLAAAAGKILRLRDNMDDKTVTDEERKKMLADNTGCGNGVYIDHGDGWQTIYCHMKKGSISVKPGQQVKAGDKIGLAGNSGIAEFPHLHFGVFFENHTIDPFTGLEAADGCGKGGTALWQPSIDLAYDPVAIYATGFKAGVPDFEAIKIDAASPASAPENSDALTFWAAFYGMRTGDVITMEISDPQGRIFARREITQEKDRARQFYYVGRKTRGEGLTKGTYTGNVQVRRADDAVTRAQSRTLAVQ